MLSFKEDTPVINYTVQKYVGLEVSQEKFNHHDICQVVVVVFVVISYTFNT